MEVRSFWHLDSETSSIQNHEVSKQEDFETIQLQTLCSHISLGSERLVAEGRIPSSLTHQMKVPHQKGDFSFPIQYGYSLIAKDDKGNRFHLMHPHQDRLKSTKNELILIPDELSDQKAAQISNMETIVNAIWDSGFQYGDQILICGIGSIGILMALTLKNQIGINLKLKETNPQKQEILKSLGFDMIEDDTTYFDICFHCSGQPEGLHFCLEHSKIEAKIVELSWYGDKNVSLPLGIDFHYKRIKLISSQVSKIPNNLVEKHSFTTRKNLVLDLLKKIEIPEVLFQSVAFDDLPQFFQAIRARDLHTAFLYTVNY